MEGLRQLQAAHPMIGEVRGRGLMIGCEIRDAERNPDKAAAKVILKACFKRRLLLLSCGPWDNTIRFIPPLIVDEAQIAEALETFAASLTSVLAPQQAAG